MERELLGRSVNAPKFLGTLGRQGWFISYTALLAEKHVEDLESKRIIVAVVLLGNYFWNIQTIRFEEVVYEANRTRRRKLEKPPQQVYDQIMGELRQAYERAKELPPSIQQRLLEAQQGEQTSGN